MEQFNAYIEQVCAKLKWKKVHPLIREELLGHLAESCEERQSEGMGTAESAALAAGAMGSAEETGAKLNALYKPRVDIPMLAALALLLFAAFFVMPPGRWAACCVALAALCAGFAAFDVRKYFGKLGNFIFLAGVAALLAVLLFAPEINGAKRLLWLTFPGMLLSVIGIGAFLGGRNVKSVQTIAAATAMALLASFLVMLQPHFTLLIILGVSLWAMSLKSGMPKPYVWALFGIAMLFVLIPIITTEYRLSRVSSWIDPEPYKTGAGYMPSLIREAWRGAQWLGASTRPVMRDLTASYILESYPLVGIVWRLGLAPAILVIAANGLLCWRMLTVSRKLADRLSSCVAFGLSMLLTLTAAFGVLGGFGLTPFNVPSLFLTSSGAYWLLQGLGVAVVFALNYNRDYIRLEQGGKMKDAKGSFRIRIKIERI